jgi:hypothetical protein
MKNRTYAQKKDKLNEMTELRADIDEMKKKEEEHVTEMTEIM